SFIEIILGKGNAGNEPKSRCLRAFRLALPEFRPHAATDPLVPDICEELVLEAEDQDLPSVALEIVQLGSIGHSSLPSCLTSQNPL
ncbi:MAG: hypothetical protein ABL962_16760, partial [Fimbriimonadaceae bacterium]